MSKLSSGVHPTKGNNYICMTGFTLHITHGVGLINVSAQWHHPDSANTLLQQLSLTLTLIPSTQTFSPFLHKNMPLPVDKNIQQTISDVKDISDFLCSECW